MNSKESALLTLMQDLGYSRGMVATAFRILSQSPEAVADALLHLYDIRPSEEDFMAYIADCCEPK